MGPEIIAGLFTLLGALSAVSGAFIEFYLHEKRTGERLFKALYDEIQLNVSVAQKTLNSIKVSRGISDSVVKPEEAGLPPYETAYTYAPLYTLSYQNIRASGYLVTLDRELRVKLERTFDKIYAYNRDGKHEHWHLDLLKNLTEELNSLNEQIPKQLKFLH